MVRPQPYRLPGFALRLVQQMRRDRRAAIARIQKSIEGLAKRVVSAKGPGGDDRARLQSDQMRPQRRGIVNVVGDNQHRQAIGPVHGQQDAHEVSAARAVKGREGFVQQQIVGSR